MRTLAEGWKFFSQMTIPKDAGPEQISGTKLAFYSGAATLMSLQINSPDVPDEELDKQIEAWLDEAKAVIVKLGRE